MRNYMGEDALLLYVLDELEKFNTLEFLQNGVDIFLELMLSYLFSLEGDSYTEREPRACLRNQIGHAFPIHPG